MERFDRKDPEANFISLAKLKQTGDAEAYISEFLRLYVMVPDISVARRVYMFIDGLEEPLHGLANSTKPITLHDAIERTRDLQDALPRAKATFPRKSTHSSKGKEGKAAPPKESSLKKPLYIDLQRELRKNKLCFTCQEPWVPGHRCAAGRAHYIEVFSDCEEEEGNDGHKRGHSTGEDEE